MTPPRSVPSDRERSGPDRLGSSSSARCVAVVLAGGASRRFGSDKLEVAVGDRSLLDRALEGLPDHVTVVVVGPERRLTRDVGFVREDPPGGGPAAAMVTGLQRALEGGADEILVLPGDAPHAGRAAVRLLQVLRRTAHVTAVVGTDATGFDQPLQLALSGGAARQLVAAAGVGAGQGGSARALVNRLEPPALRWPLATDEHWDVDTPEQLQVWRGRRSPAVASILAAVDAVNAVERNGRPVVVALDGRSGSGKSTLGAALALHRPLTLVEGDDFYSSELASLDGAFREQLTDDEVVDAVIDWRRLRTDALEPLVQGHPVRFARYDWEANDGRLGREVALAASELVVVEGVYSARPELADLVDLAVYVDVDADSRRRRLLAREHDLHDWVDLWERGENHYFGCVRPVDQFDLHVWGADAR